MKHIAIFLCLVAPAAIAGTTHVDGYVRKDGTYVPPHVRTTPDQYKFNNYSSQGNINPYTGQKGTQPNELTPYNPYNQQRR